MHISPTMKVITTKSIHIIKQELMSLLHGNRFSPWEDLFVNSSVLMSSILTKYVQVNDNLERDCIKSRRDKIGITRHIMMHQVLYNVHVTLFIGQLHNI